MTNYTLIPLNNSIKPSEDNEISYRIICGEPDPNIKVKYIDINLSKFVDLKKWQDAVPIMKDASAEKKADGSVVFKLYNTKSFEKKEGTSSDFEFSIEGIWLDPAIKSDQQAEISFGLRSLTGKLAGATYTNSFVIIDEKKPVITTFSLTPSIIRPKDKVTISYECEEVEVCTITDEKGFIIEVPEVIDGRCRGTIIYKQVLDDKLTNMLYLEAKSGNAIATENSVATVKVIKDPAIWNETALQETVFVDLKNDETTYGKRNENSDFVDLILNTHEKMLWAFGRLAKSKEDADVCLWYSGDGLDWSPYKVKTEDAGKVILKNVYLPSAFIHSPAVFVDDLLYFVCGSKVDIGKCSNKLKVFNYQKNQWLPDIDAPAKMKARCMHGCVVFPYEGIDNIWVIGGADKNGNGLNDVWRYDGKVWNQVDATGLPKRCGFSITVEPGTDDNKPGIWLAGGMDNYEGNRMTDVWNFDGTWRQIKKVDTEIKPLVLINQECRLDASAFSCLHLAGNTNSIVAHNIYKDGNDYKMGYNWIMNKGKVDIRGQITDNYQMVNGRIMDFPGWKALFSSLDSCFVLTSLGFNGCVWLLAHNCNANGSVLSSQLYYSIPG